MDVWLRTLLLRRLPPRRPRALFVQAARPVSELWRASNVRRGREHHRQHCPQRAGAAMGFEPPLRAPFTPREHAGLLAQLRSWGFDGVEFPLRGMSVADARDLGLLSAADSVSMNPERLIADAKALALSLVPGYVPGLPRSDIKVAGDAGYALLKLGIYMARQGNYITEYDTVVGEKLAYVLSGGRGTGEQKVSEQYLLDLEREAFLSLCGQAKTQERMQHILKTGKPLRN